MKKLLLLALLLVGCAPKPKITNILDGKISSNSTTLKTDDIKEDCKKECITFSVSSNEWCDCMHQCSSNRLKDLPFNNRIYIEECWTDSIKIITP